MKNYSSKLNLFVVLAIFLFVAFGCESDGAKRRRLDTIANTAREEGEKAGRAEGHKNAYEPAKKSAYDQKIWEIYNSGNYNRKSGYVALILGVVFLLGFGFQYGILYLLRRKEILFDIDRIILSRDNTLTNFNEFQNSEIPSNYNKQEIK